MKSVSTSLFFLVMMLALAGSTVLAFPPSMLGSAQHTPLSALSVAGQSRSCSQYADETGTFTGAISITSKSLPALIDIYLVNANGGWTYYNEFTAPLSFSGGNRQYAYEIYYCPTVVSSSCSNGQARAITETTYQTCANGAWSSAQSCPSLSYFNPATSSCVSTATTCMQRWTCGNYGACTSGGLQYRSCTDLNSCGSFNQEPATQQACTPVLSQGGTSASIAQGLSLVGQPHLDLYTGSAGLVRTVTQQFQVTTPGSYWIEAGIEQLRGYNIAGTVEHNTCNPNEPWYANQLVSFTTPGLMSYSFQVTPATDGEYVLHTAIVTGCAGAVVQQVNAADHLIIGNPAAGGSTGSFASGWGLGTWLLLAAAVLFLVALIVWVLRR